MTMACAAHHPSAFWHILIRDRLTLRSLTLDRCRGTWVLFFVFLGPDRRGGGRTCTTFNWNKLSNSKFSLLLSIFWRLSKRALALRPHWRHSRPVTKNALEALRRRSGQQNVESVCVRDLVTIQDPFHGSTQSLNEGVGQTILGDEIPLLHGT